MTPNARSHSLSSRAKRGTFTSTLKVLRLRPRDARLRMAASSARLQERQDALGQIALGDRPAEVQADDALAVDR